jgi:phage tail sheath gpL-like
MRPVLMCGLVEAGLSFNPVPDTYNRTHRSNVSFTITATQPVVWNWSAIGDLPTSSVPNGGTASSITISLSASGSDTKDSTVTVTTGENVWTLNLTSTGALVLGGGGP